MVFSECFVELLEDEYDFEISQRKSLNLNKVREKVTLNNLTPFVIDISINGYSTKDDFDFTVKDTKWSEVKNLFKKGQDAQNDPEALTVKRAIRVCSKVTSNYIDKFSIITHLNPYACDDLEEKYKHLGGVYVVPFSQKDYLIEMWQNFDRIKHTQITPSILRILQYRFA